MSARELAPSYGVISGAWERVENQTALTSNRGDSDVLEIADPYWEFEARVKCASREHFDEWDAFFGRRNLSEHSFLIWRYLRPLPQDRLITSDALLGLAGIDVTNSQISLNGFGAGRTAHRGDMISYRTADNGYWIGQALNTVVADGAGNVTIDVWPRPWAAHAGDPDPRRIRALGEFRLIEKPRPKEDSKDWEWRFKAEQVLI